MKFYIVDDDPYVTMILQEIIEADFTNIVCKATHDSTIAYKDLLVHDVDIVLIDLLMPDLDGIALVKKIHKIRPELKFIMISQVKDSLLRQNAYKAGIEFFINKPINIVEVNSIVKKIKEIIDMEKKLIHIENLFKTSPSETVTPAKTNEQFDKIYNILSYIGITSESGYNDIITIFKILSNQNISFEQLDFKTHLGLNPHEQKIMLQRIRRAIKKAMINIAHLCIDDFENEITLNYANSLFGYQNIHMEIQFIQHTSSHGGKISIKRFFNELLIQAQ